MKAGIGYSNISLSKEAGRQAVSSALADATLSSAMLSADDMVLAFCGASVNADEFYQGSAAVSPQKSQFLVAQPSALLPITPSVILVIQPQSPC